MDKPSVFSVAWWEAAGSRAAYTAIAAVIPMVTLVMAGEASPLAALSITALAAFASLLTSVAGLPEVAGKTVALWRAVLTRSLKTAGQVGIPALGAATLVQDVDWQAFGVAVGGAVLVTVLRTLRDYLPETENTLLQGAPDV